MSDLDFVISIIPSCYKVLPSKDKEGSIHCVSTGTNEGMDFGQWDHFCYLIGQQFGKRIQEIYHDINMYHQDFTIYLKAA